MQYIGVCVCVCVCVCIRVCRCGMIYMEPHQLGWTPLRDSYMDTLPTSLSEEHIELVRLTL